MKRINLLTLCLAIVVSTTGYSMEPEDPSPEYLDLSALTLDDTENPPQAAQGPQTPRTPPTQMPGQRSRQITTTRRAPLQQIGSPAVSPPAMRPIQSDGPEQSPVASPQPVVTASPRPDTPNTTLSRTAEQVLRDVDSGAISAREGLERIRQFLPTRSGRSSENRNPQTPDQNRN